MSAGYEQLATDISALFSARAPPFVYVNDPISPATTAHVVNSVLSTLAHSPNASCRVNHAQVNAVTCFTPRILYDSVINQLAGWTVKWADGCANWGGERWNSSLDSFFHGLKAVDQNRLNKGKAKQTDEDLVDEDAQIIIVVERAERLQEEMADLIVPLTRLAELTELQLSLVFVSDAPWEDIRPAFGGSPDPYYVDVSPPNKQALERRLLSAFDHTSSQQPDQPNPYHPALRPFYAQFLPLLLDSCMLYVQDPNELQYIAAARWPGFVQPILDAHRNYINGNRLKQDVDVNMDENEDHDTTGLRPPRESVRMRLIGIFKPTFATALNTLYPRLDHATSWAAANRPEANLLARPSGQMKPLAVASAADGDEAELGVEDGKMSDLPRMSKFLLVAAYLASTNPANKDMTMFGRGQDERKKRKRRAFKGAAKGGAAKPPQRVLGPNPFPLDRLIAIFGALLEENDVDARRPAPEYTIPGEQTDMESARVGIYNTIVELTDIRLLHRMSTADKLDAPTFKCGISYLTAAKLARELDIPLNDLLWDPA